MKKKSVAVLISGRGSNLKALHRATQAPDFPAEIVAVISDKKDAGGLAYAAAEGLEAIFLNPKDYADKASFDRALGDLIEARRVDVICLAGFMRILSPEFCTRFAGRAINIHPSLLPAFKGLNTHERALKAGVKFSGCSVHYVTPGVDEGAIIGQAATPVLPDDTPESLAARVLEAEWRLYSACLRAVITRKAEDFVACSFFNPDR